MKLLFLGLGAGKILCYLCILFLGNLRNEVSACIGLFSAAFVFYSHSLIILRRKNCWAKISGNVSRSELKRNDSLTYYLIVILSISILARFLLFLSPPTFSDDIYRYVWEERYFPQGSILLSLLPTILSLKTCVLSVIASFRKAP